MHDRSVGWPTWALAILIVLGGLIQDDITFNRSKVPLLGDIPFLGRLFRTDKETREKRILLVFLRPTIIRKPEDAQALTKRKYNGIYEVMIRSRAPTDMLPAEENIKWLFDSPDMGTRR